MEQRPVNMSEFSIVRQHRRILANMSFFLNQQSQILDFGCGIGRNVYEFRDAGFKAYGFDVVNGVQLRDKEDEEFFKFALSGQPLNVPDYSIKGSSYHIPFDDKFFDFIFSSQVLEHVMDYDLALAQMARVLREGGVAIHVFPARYSLIEPHIFVPLAGCIQNYSWFLLWALLGVRNQFQHGMGPSDRAKINLKYAKTGINYLKIQDLLAIAKKYFSEVQLIPHLWELGDQGSLSLKGRFIHGIPLIKRVFRRIYNHCDTVVLFLRK